MRTDLDIQQDVIAQLHWEPGLGGVGIGVAVSGGVVMLSGIVDTYYKKVLAERAARKVSGVRAVAEEIIVEVPGGKTFTDVDIAKAVLHVLKWNSTIREEDIQVTVENAEVTLEGETEWNFQRTSAQQAIESLVGIRRIINNLRVKKHVTAQDVKAHIFDAFMRHANVDARKLNVSVEGDTVILTGMVSSLSEKIDAENMAWASLGVTDVDNRLEVYPATDQ